LEKLYGGKPLNSKILEDEDSLDNYEKGYHILRSEFDTAVKDPKERKAPGIDGISSEFLKNAGDKTLKKLYELICDI
jgi:hypothetical protein